MLREFPASQLLRESPVPDLLKECPSLQSVQGSVPSPDLQVSHFRFVSPTAAPFGKNNFRPYPWPEYWYGKVDSGRDHSDHGRLSRSVHWAEFSGSVVSGKCYRFFSHSFPLSHAAFPPPHPSKLPSVRYANQPPARRLHRAQSIAVSTGPNQLAC